MTFECQSSLDSMQSEKDLKRQLFTIDPLPSHILWRMSSGWCYVQSEIQTRLPARYPFDIWRKSSSRELPRAVNKKSFPLTDHVKSSLSLHALACTVAA